MKRVFCVSLCIFLLVICASCRVGSDKAYVTSDAAELFSEESSETSRMAMNKNSVAGYSYDNGSLEAEVTYDDASGVATDILTSDVNGERKLVKTGYLTFEVSSLSDTQTAIEKWAQSFGGYVTDSWSNRTDITVTVKIPASSFDDAMAVTGAFGRILGRSVSSEDVSEQYYDLETRINTRRILKEKLESYLKNASSTSDLLEIESQLNNVVTEIESMEGRFRRLSGRIDYSTITVSGSLPSNTTDDGPERPEFLRNLSEMGSNFLYFLSTVALVLLYIIIFGVPLVAVLALLWWLCFGRLGLIRKLFIKLTKK